jgi:hypothetical protein
VKLRATSRLALAGAAIVALPLTTACQTRIGEAASVGGQRIETSQLTSVTARSQAALAASGNPLPAGQVPSLERSVLNLLVQDALLQQIGNQKGITVTPAEIATEHAAEARQAGGEAALATQLQQSGLSPTDLPLAIEKQLLVNKLQSAFGTTDTNAISKALTAMAQRIAVRVNPRFGQWDAKNLTIVGAPNDLSSTITKS